jgi:hypothetical protein
MAANNLSNKSVQQSEQGTRACQPSKRQSAKMSKQQSIASRGFLFLAIFFSFFPFFSLFFLSASRVQSRKQRPAFINFAAGIVQMQSLYKALSV